MNTFIRWCKFNLVGAMGMLIQLTTLALLNQYAHGHYLVATAAALELTLVHNFLWHLNFTWRDRRSSGALTTQFAQFHLANGVVSLVGNLALMRLLVGAMHLPVVLSNAMAILCCSTANFVFGNRLVFAEET